MLRIWRPPNTLGTAVCRGLQAKWSKVVKLWARNLQQWGTGLLSLGFAIQLREWMRVVIGKKERRQMLLMGPMPPTLEPPHPAQQFTHEINSRLLSNPLKISLPFLPFSDPQGPILLSFSFPFPDLKADIWCDFKNPGILCSKAAFPLGLLQHYIPGAALSFVEAQIPPCNL